MVLNTRPRALRFARYALIAVLVWFALALVSYLALPAYIKQLAITQTDAQIGRKLDIGKVDFNLFTLAVHADDIVLYEPDGTTPAFSAKSLIANASIASLFRLAPVFDELKLTAPTMHIVRLSSKDIGVYNFSDILDRIAAMPKSEGKTHFAIGNIQLTQGDIQFDDKVSGKSIHVADLDIGIPYISNFNSKIDTFVQPKLSANINGTPFALTGRSKPFTSSHETALAIDIDKLDLVSYLPFLPAALPVQLQSAVLSTKLDLSFSQTDAHPHVSLSGNVVLDNVAVADKASAPLFKTRQAAVTLTNLDVLNVAGTIEKATIESPEVWASMDAQGQLNWVKALASKPATKTRTVVAQNAPTAQTPESGAAPASDTASTTTSASTTEPAPALTLRQFTINEGTVNWSDQANAKPRQQVTLSNIAIDAKAISTAANAPAGTFSIAATENIQGQLTLLGTINPVTMDISAQAALKDIALGGYQNYVNPYVNGALTGKLSGQTDVTINNAQVTLANLGIVIEQAKLASKQAGTVTIKTATIQNGTLDTAKRTATLDALQLSGLHGDVRRDTNGQLNVAGFMHASSAAPTAESGAGASTGANATAKKPAGKEAAWVAKLGTLSLLDSSVNYQDDSVGARQSLQATGINIKLDNLSSGMNTPSKLTAQAKFNRNGQLSVNGTSTAGFKKIDLAVDAKNVPVAPWQAFFTEYVNVVLTRGNLNAKGDAALTLPVDGAAFAMTYKGNAGLTNFRMLNKANEADFLRWKDIDFSGIDVNIGKTRPVISVKKLALSDFFARVELAENGRLNLQDLLVSNEHDASASTTVGGKTTSKEPVTSSEQSATAPLLRVDQITIAGGNINFTDNFVKPNYRANMTSLQGTIGTITSDKIDPADVDIKGKIDNDAPLVISGAINPLFKPLFLDIKASAHGIEMTRLTPYSTKYAGYPIEKGKLSMDVSYKIDADKLVAENSLRIDQLTFGAHVTGPDVTKLPVMLAVSLLKDRDGTINVNLPVSGSLSDPQFSIGGVIMRVFVNLIVKAVTSPFALIGSMFGSSEELSNVRFAAGSADLNPEIIKRMDMINTAMVDRPGLKLDILGRADPKVDEAGIAEDRLNRQMRALKRREMPVGQRTADSATTLTPQEEIKYLTEVYKRAKFDKPKNAIGFAKSIPPEEMKALILQNTTVSKEELQTLAMNRADAIRNYMQREGNVPAERMYLVSPKLTTEDIKGAENGARVDFSLK